MDFATPRISQSKISDGGAVIFRLKPNLDPLSQSPVQHSTSGPPGWGRSIASVAESCPAPSSIARGMRLIAESLNVPESGLDPGTSLPTLRPDVSNCHVTQQFLEKPPSDSRSALGQVLPVQAVCPQEQGVRGGYSSSQLLPPATLREAHVTSTQSAVPIGQGVVPWGTAPSLAARAPPQLDAHSAMDDNVAACHDGPVAQQRQ